DPPAHDLHTGVQRLADTVDDTALHLIEAAAGVDDLVAHIHGHPHLVHLHAAVAVDGGLAHLREVAQVRVVARDTHAGALGQLLLAVAGHLRHLLQHPGHAAGVEAGRRRPESALGRG